jgi:hypothetical protein
MDLQILSNLNAKWKKFKTIPSILSSYHGMNVAEIVPH